MNVTALPLCSPVLLNDTDRPLRSPNDLAAHTLLHDETPYEGRPDWASWLSAVGAHGVDGHRGLRFNRVSLALAAAVEAQGVVLSLEQLAADDLQKGRLVIPFQHRVELTNAYHVITLADTVDDERVQAFKQWLFDEVAAPLSSLSA
jgi:LysR family glycine cleavage system transcriptional activator